MRENSHPSGDGPPVSSDPVQLNQQLEAARAEIQRLATENVLLQRRAAELEAKEKLLCSEARSNQSAEEQRAEVAAFAMTERKRAQDALFASEERLRLVVEGAMEHAIISTDLGRNVTSWNSGAEQIFGFLRGEIVGRSLDVIFTPEDRAQEIPAHEAKRALEEGRAPDNRWQMRNDGSQFWAHGVMLPLYERSGGAATGFIKIVRDDTEYKLALQKLEKSRQQLVIALNETTRARAEAEAATHARDDFLAALSHELRTPLNPVLLLASEAVGDTSLPEQVREMFRVIQDNVQIEARLIDDLLDLTRITHGKVSLDLRKTDAHSVVTVAAGIVRPEAMVKHVDLALNLKAERTELYADEVRLQQIVWNVLKNAVKFTPAGGKVEIRTWNPPRQEKLVIAVADSGIGMTPTEIAGVFDPFVQGEHANERSAYRFGGLGLGLAIARMLVELHGGVIRATSEGRGRGSTFEIELPIATRLT